MAAWVAPAIAAGASLLSNILGGKEAEKQREWQEYMSSTAHQREVADLQKAGLNPILSAGGSGSSTPSGAMNPNTTIDGGSIIEAMKFDTQMELQKQQTAQSAQQTKNDTQRTQNETAATKADILNKMSQKQLNDLDAKQRRGGSLVNFLGTDTYDMANKPVPSPGPAIRRGIKAIQPKEIFRPSQMNQPPSSGASIRGQP